MSLINLSTVKFASPAEKSSSRFSFHTFSEMSFLPHVRLIESISNTYLFNFFYTYTGNKIYLIQNNNCPAYNSALLWISVGNNNY